MTDSIKIDTPATIRGYFSGGKGGYGYRSTELHRLVERRVDKDVTACGASLVGQKVVVTDGKPSPRMAKKYGVCPKCWTW